MADEEAQDLPNKQNRPLLDPKPSNEDDDDDDDDSKTTVLKAISQTFQSVAHLAVLLPTGTVLAFQVLSPLLTNQGHCDHANRTMTACLLAICGFFCFALSFTDSFRDGSGKVRYGIATRKGLWVIDSGPLPRETAASYRLRFIDFAHAFMSVLVFAAVALFDTNVQLCFYPVPSEEVRQVLIALPVAIGVLGSAFFVTFPTTRHGIGFPLSLI